MQCLNNTHTQTLKQDTTVKMCQKIFVELRGSLDGLVELYSI